MVFALWNKQGWIVAATDGGLRLARRPRLGRARDVKAAWSDLTDVRAGSQRVDLGFGRLEVRLSFVQPHDEFVRLVEAARRRVPGGAGDVTVAELRELARRKLGRMLAFAHESAIEALPDRLEPDERVERLATATVGFKGLLAVTNRRVLLFEPGFRAAGERPVDGGTPRRSPAPSRPATGCGWSCRRALSCSRMCCLWSGGTSCSPCSGELSAGRSGRGSRPRP